jgi:hypothetical protein
MNKFGVASKQNLLMKFRQNAAAATNGRAQGQI